MAHKAFTLIELIVVLVIIAAMMTVVVPYATRSNDNLKITHDCLSLTEALRFAADLAIETKRPTRVVIDTGRNLYLLETADSFNNQVFVPIEYLGTTVNHFSSKTRIVDIEGFSMDADRYYLLFEPSQPWPDASISVSNDDVTKTIIIDKKNVRIEESTI